MNDKKKIDKERQMSYDSLPPSIKENLTEEEKQLFLYAEQWPDTLFEKLEEFIIKD
ncbi:MAG: hypothetical protein KKE44_01985 [Proteobacteria bacterium]|nr:hypothetical protein [Pseudomonadota bacterium]MBU1581497.1 hypothetical protein [Pseudomonadota bacterium]MBU2455155.1 hypothetical protein [Pseudomonadota bacterium]MBU2628864.1 hypothetical protein [Pseudomonadota bacterium]